MSYSRIGFTGTQLGMTVNQRAALYTALQKFCRDGGQFHHGDCIGADAEAHKIAESLGLTIVIHPPIKENKRAFCGDYMSRRCPPKDYIERNHDIVDMTDILIVAPKSNFEELRSGTWATYRYAKKQGKLIIMLEREINE
jgi:hypothetical protein